MRKQMVETLSHKHDNAARKHCGAGGSHDVYPMKSVRHYISLGLSAHMFLVISMQPPCIYTEGSCLVANLFS